jgi:hypothetical protein
MSFQAYLRNIQAKTEVARAARRAVQRGNPLWSAEVNAELLGSVPSAVCRLHQFRLPRDP